MSVKKSEKQASLHAAFLSMLRPFYSEAIAQQLAEAHCEAHGQFLRELYLDSSGDRRPKAGVVRGKLRRKRPDIVQATRKIFHKSKAIHSRAKSVPMQDVRMEVVGYLSAVADPASMVDILEACRSFGWTLSQIKRAVRELRGSGEVRQVGSKKFARYATVLQPPASGPTAS